MTAAQLRQTVACAQPVEQAPPIVLALNGSERSAGNTAQILEHVRERMAEHGILFQSVALAEITMQPCGPCGDCNTRPNQCDVVDDVADIVRRMTLSDGIIYAMPVHGFGSPSLMQTFIERAGVGHLRFQRPLANKVGGVVVVGRRYSHTEVVSQLYHNIMLNRMLLVGSGFPAIVRTEGLTSPFEDSEGITATDAMIDRMAEMIWMLRDHRARLPERAAADDDDQQQALS